MRRRTAEKIEVVRSLLNAGFSVRQALRMAHLGRSSYHKYFKLIWEGVKPPIDDTVLAYELLAQKQKLNDVSDGFYWGWHRRRLADLDEMFAESCPKTREEWEESRMRLLRAFGVKCKR